MILFCYCKGFMKPFLPWNMEFGMDNLPLCSQAMATPIWLQYKTPGANYQSSAPHGSLVKLTSN